MELDDKTLEVLEDQLWELKKELRTRTRAMEVYQAEVEKWKELSRQLRRVANGTCMCRYSTMISNQGSANTFHECDRCKTIRMYDKEAKE